MALIGSDTTTKWIFLLPSASEAEGRHIHDIAFGISCLESKAIKAEDIRLFIDHTNSSSTQYFLRMLLPTRYTLKPSSLLFDEFIQNTHDNIVLFVFGHGNVCGLAGENQIKPHQLFSKIRKAPRLKLGVVFLSQCYAGVFNYMNVSEERDDKNNLIHPPLIVVGATNLFTSISSSTTETLGSKERTWLANLFLLNLFRWIKDPQDIDGDGLYTIMDWYKFAGAQANTACIKIKCEQFKSLLNTILSLRDIEKRLAWLKRLTLLIRLTKNKKIQRLTLEHDALVQQIQARLFIQFNHQEPWILNSIPAQYIKVF